MVERVVRRAEEIFCQLPGKRKLALGADFSLGEVFPSLII